MSELQDLPPGWESRYDSRSHRFYFINHQTKLTTWDDPRKTKKANKNVACEYIPLQDVKMSIQRSSTNKTQETCMNFASNTEESVMKISSMFPTASETHIRMLLKNYRYMKSIFPQAEETIILDVLTSNENNIQRTSTVLKEMGFQKKDTVNVIKETHKEVNESKIEIQTDSLPDTSIMKSAEQKAEIKAILQRKYDKIAEQVIIMALESVNYNLSNAEKILQLTAQEEDQRKNEVSGEDNNISNQEKETSITSSISVQSVKSLLKIDTSEVLHKFNAKDNANVKFKNTNVRGPNPEYVKGPNEKLLLEDYIKWQGHNVCLQQANKIKAKGHDSNILLKTKCLVKGPNKNFRKGPKMGLAKGNIVDQFKQITITDSRGN